MKSKKLVEIMDTTLRDGEQTTHGNFSPQWKLKIAEELLEAGVDRIEVCSARGYSKKEQGMLAEVVKSAKKRNRDQSIEVLAFVDHEKSADWADRSGAKTINLLCKGSERHCQGQLRQSAKKHFENIKDTVQYAASKHIAVNIYLEDWSQGMMDSPDYVRNLLSWLYILPVGRIMLCDTMGILNPWTTEKFVKKTLEWQRKFHYDFHGHNDYGFAVSNTLAALRAGASGGHCTVNGLGERTGNAALDEVTLGIRDHLPQFSTNVKVSNLRGLAADVSLMSGNRIPQNKPILGKNVFSNTAGVHADGDRKKNLYVHRWLNPADFGMKTRHPMGKLSGKANVVSNLERLGWDLTESEVEKVLLRIVHLSDEGKRITLGDLPFIVASVLNRPELVVFEVLSVDSRTQSKKGALSRAVIRYRGKEYSIEASGDGGFDAFMCALNQWAKKESGVAVPELIDYYVNIPPGGTTAALVHATVEWQFPGKLEKFSTSGVHSDQVLAAIEAAALAVNLCNCETL